jgi:branched-chain amino acid transport system permease protein
MGDDMLATVLMLVIMADTGSIGGIIVVGLILGCLNAVSPVVLTDDYAQAIYVAIVVVILLSRPQGFFGHELGQDNYGQRIMSGGSASDDKILVYKT